MQIDSYERVYQIALSGACTGYLDHPFKKEGLG